MKEEAKISFYKISRCGYYKRGKEVPEFGNIAELLKELQLWIKRDNRPLVDTCTFQITESDASLRTFCFGLEEHNQNDDFLLTTWNETPHTDGMVAAVQANKPVGSAEVVFREIPKGAVPGYATYFWFLPSLNVFATIRFQHAVNGHQSMARYLREFSAKFTSHAVTKESAESDEVLIVGYRRQASDSPLPLLSQFHSANFRKPAKIEYLTNNHEKIRKIIRKNCLNASVDEHLEYWQKAIRFLGMQKNTPAFEEIHVKQEIDYRPNKSQLEEIIANWLADHESGWDDVGFVLNGAANDVQWLSHSFVKDTIEIDVKRQNDEVIDGESLLNSLVKHRARLITLLTEEANA